MNDDDKLFEKSDTLYADWGQIGMILEACSKMITDNQVNDIDDFKLLMTSVNFALLTLIKMWESDMDTMEFLDMCKRFREIEDDLAEAEEGL